MSSHLFSSKKTPHVSHRLLIVIGIFSTVFSLLLQMSGAIQLFEWAVFDQWLRLRSLDRSAPPIVIVTVDDTDIAVNGDWPLNDAQLAQLITILRSQHPIAIGLDLYRDLPVPPGSDELHQVFQTTPNLIGIQKSVGQGSIVAVPPPRILQNQDQVAFNDLVLDSDGHVRRHLLSLRQDEEMQFALGTRLALMYLKEQFQITLEPLAKSRVRLGKAEFIPLTPDAGGYANADVGGYQILANYLRPSAGMMTVSMRDVMNRQFPEGLMSNKIVFIGLKADSSWGDRFQTPYSQDSRETWAGVEIHANLAAQLITSALGERPSLKVWPELAEQSWILFWACVGTLCSPVLSISWRYLARFPIAIALLLATTYLFFQGGYWLPLISPLMALSIGWLATQGYLVRHRLREENRILQRAVQERTQALVEKNQQLELARAEAETANQAKSNFLAHMSHELRTPLTAILGFGNLLSKSQDLPAVEKEYAQTINQSGEHLLTLINNVLEISKIEAGGIILNPETVHLQLLITNVHRMFQGQVAAKQISCNLTFVEPLPIVVRLDGGKLRQILINLLGNSIKFTSSGYVNLDVRLVSLSEGQDLVAGKTYQLECSIEDTGPGFAEAEIKQIFQPFVQTAVGKKQRQGTGLGLALAYQYVECMGGNIEVISSLGKGSRFSFRVPATVLQLSSATDSSHLEVPLSTGNDKMVQSNNYRVLVVDDDSNNQRLLLQWLAEAHFETQSAENGISALEICKQWHPHLILLDVHLPDIDGYEVARRIREDWAAEIETSGCTSWLDMQEPVILAVTAGVLQNKYAELLGAGCDDVVWKPTQSATLLGKIAEHLPFSEG